MDNKQKRKRNDQNEDTKKTQCSSASTGVSTKKQNNNAPVSEQEQHNFLVEADGNDDGDWKRPLFYWKGDLNIKSAQSTARTIHLEWEGTWISDLASNGVPSAEEFDDVNTKESNSFHLTSKISGGKAASTSTSTSTSTSVLEKEGSKIDDDDDTSNLLSSLRGKSGSFRGTYFLDQGDGRGPTKQKDYQHKFIFASSTTARKIDGSDAEILFVCASGKTEFGNFVSSGYVHEKVQTETETVDEPRLELILARRYIDDDDARCSRARARSSVCSHESILDLTMTLQLEKTAKSCFWTVALPRTSNVFERLIKHLKSIEIE